MVTTITQAITMITVVSCHHHHHHHPPPPPSSPPPHLPPPHPPPIIPLLLLPLLFPLLLLPLLLVPLLLLPLLIIIVIIFVIIIISSSAPFNETGLYFTWILASVPNIITCVHALCSQGFGNTGTILEGPIVGWIAERYGWTAPFYLMIFLSLCGFLSMVKVTRMEASVQKEQNFMSSVSSHGIDV